MNAASRQQVRELIAASLRLPSAARRAFVAEHCQDPTLLEEIEDLLKRAAESGSDGRSFLRSSEATSFVSPGTVEAGVNLTGDLLPRFRMVRRLGSGNFGDVYKVFDERTHSELALKILRNATPSALYHFKREFRNLAAFRHENVARLYELLFAQGEWMFTMELIDGLPFHRYVNRSSDELVLRDALSQLINGISALHAGGLLHRDLKPSNVLVTAEGRVVVVDFGLVRELDASETQGTLSLAGTRHGARSRPLLAL